MGPPFFIAPTSVDRHDRYCYLEASAVGTDDSPVRSESPPEGEGLTDKAKEIAR